MTQPAKVQEPSMEEILASIRRIIADDEAKPAVCGEARQSAARTRQAGGRSHTAGRQAAGDEGYSALGDRAGAQARCRRAQACTAAGRARTGRQQQPGRHRRDAGEPRRGDARGRDQAAAARRRGVRTDRRHGAAGSAAARGAPGGLVPQDRPAGRYRIHRSARRQGVAGRRPTSRRRSRAPQHLRRSRSCRARPCPRSNPPSIRSPIPCSATTRGRWKIWSRKCCARC